MTHFRAFLLMIFSVLLVNALPAYAGGSEEGAQPATPETSAAAQTITVDIKNIKFSPAELTVTTGTTVKWINLDPVDHDVTSGKSLNGRQTRGMQQTKFPDNKFASGLFGENKSFSHTFNEKGEYSYYCNIHPFMVAKIIVK